MQVVGQRLFSLLLRGLRSSGTSLKSAVEPVLLVESLFRRLGGRFSAGDRSRMTVRSLLLILISLDLERWSHVPDYDGNTGVC